MEKPPDLLKSELYRIVFVGTIDEVAVNIPFATMEDAWVYAEHLGYVARKGSQIFLTMLDRGIPVAKVDSSQAHLYQ